jgi:hypothetical protein
MSYKFYHDLAMDIDYSAFAHGPCWEPTISQAFFFFFFGVAGPALPQVHGMVRPKS